MMPAPCPTPPAAWRARSAPLWRVRPALCLPRGACRLPACSRPAFLVCLPCAAHPALPAAPPCCPAPPLTPLTTRCCAGFVGELEGELTVDLGDRVKVRACLPGWLAGCWQGWLGVGKPVGGDGGPGGRQRHGGGQVAAWCTECSRHVGDLTSAAGAGREPPAGAARHACACEAATWDVPHPPGAFGGGRLGARHPAVGQPHRAGALLGRRA